MALTNRLFSDAFRDLQRAMAVFDQPIFNSFGPSAFGGASHHGGHNMLRFPATDIVEKNNMFEVQAELPGYDKNNIKIEMPDSHTLVLSGSHAEQHETRTGDESGTEQQQASSSTSEEKLQESQVVQKKDEDSQVASFRPHYWMNERVSGSFTRTFRFPNPVKPDDIKASFKNGVLKVTVPKVSENQPKQITIE